MQFASYVLRQILNEVLKFLKWITSLEERKFSSISYSLS